VLTDLFVAAARLNPASIERSIPPACRRPVDEVVASVDGDIATLETDEWKPRRGARHLVPALSLLDGGPCSFRFEACALVEGHWTSWIATATIGAPVFSSEISSRGPLTVEVDVFRAMTPVERIRLRVRVHPASAVAHPLLITLSTCDLDPSLESEPRSAETTTLAVPARSQMEESEEIRARICSPTSLAMVLEYWGQSASVRELAAEIFHRELDCYGVWPAAIAAAARRGLAGYLLRFPDWSVAAWCLREGLPIIASIRYEADELEGAAMPRTDGHLVVLTGEDLTHVYVNDPAGRTMAEVERRYRREQLCRVWLERSGVGYVFFPPEHSVSTRREEPVQSPPCTP
jgi:hypothetical protein